MLLNTAASSRANRILITKVLSSDMTVLAFVPSALSPPEASLLHQQHCSRCIRPLRFIYFFFDKKQTSVLNLRLLQITSYVYQSITLLTCKFTWYFYAPRLLYYAF